MSSFGIWGEIYTEMNAPEYQPVREPVCVTDSINRCMVLAPTQADNAVGKAERARTLITDWESSEDVILNKVYVTVHLIEKLNHNFERWKTRADDVFVCRVKEQLVELKFKADTEYVMLEGKLAGFCDPARTTFEFGTIKR